MADSKCNLALYGGRSRRLTGLTMIALILALMLTLISPQAYANSSVGSSSAENAESVSQNPPKVDNPASPKTCPRCREATAHSPRCRNCGLILRTSPARFIPYGLGSRARYDLNSIDRSNKSINGSTRSLQKSLRDMNTSINRIRIYNRRF